MPDDSDLPSKWAHEDSAHIDVTKRAESIASLDEPLLIYTDRRQAISKLNKRMILLVPLLALYGLLVGAEHLLFFAGPLLLLWGAVYLLTVRNFNRNTEPLLTIDARGIKVHGLITRCFVSWDNLDKFEPYSMIYRFVGINPKSVMKMDAAPWTRILLLMNAFSRLFYGLIGQKVYAINIPEQYSHFKAEEICEQIEARRQHYASLSAGGAGPSAKNMQNLNANALGAGEESPTKAISPSDESASNVIKLKELTPEKLPNQEN